MANLGYIDVAELEVGPHLHEGSIFHVWRDENCPGSAGLELLNYKIKVTHPDCLKTTPGKGTIVLGNEGVTQISVQCLKAPAAGQESKMRLMVQYSTPEGVEEKYKIAVRYVDRPPPAAEAAAPPAVAPADFETVTEEPPAAAASSPAATDLPGTTAGEKKQPASEPTDLGHPTDSTQPPNNSTTAGAEATSTNERNGDKPPPSASSASSSKPTFDISFTIGSVESPSIIAGSSYQVSWKRSTLTGSSNITKATSNGVLELEALGAANLTGCTVDYKPDGNPARRLLQITITNADTAEVVGTVKFDASQCEEGERSADVPMKPEGQLVDVRLGMHNTTQAAAATQEQEAGTVVAHQKQPQQQHVDPTANTQEEQQQPVSAAPLPPPPSASAGESTAQSSAALDLLERMKAKQASPRPSRPAAGDRAQSPRIGGRAGDGEHLELPSTAERGGSQGGGHNPLGNFETEVVPEATTSNVGVYVRVRPIGEQATNSWNIIDSGMTLQDKTSKNKYTVDKVFDQPTTNMDIYRELGAKLIDGLVNGINGTLFMYGQTASGKTHTIFGTGGEEGQVNLLLKSLFQQVADTKAAVESAGGAIQIAVHVSYFEIYNEELNDLLEPSSVNMPVRASKNGGFAADVKQVPVRSVSEALDILAAGTENKHMGQSVLNDRSSRSHSIFQLKVKKKTSDGTKTKTLAAELNLVDLAGSETLSDSGDAANKKETAHINLSLTYLKKVIKERADEAKFVSFRNSSLTKILKNSLGGNSKTILICCIHAAQEQRKDTRNTLIFGTTAKTVKTVVKVNASLASRGGGASSEELRRLNEELSIANETIEAYKGVEEDLKQAQTDNAELLKQLETTYNHMMSQQAEMDAKTKELEKMKKKLKDAQERAATQKLSEDVAASKDQTTTGVRTAGLKVQTPPAEGDHGNDKDDSKAADVLLEDFEDVPEVTEEADESSPPTTTNRRKKDEHQSNNKEVLADDEMVGFEEVDEVEEVVDDEEAKRNEEDEAARRRNDQAVFLAQAALQKCKQDIIQMKMQHREELRRKEEELYAAQQDQVKASDEVAEVMGKETKIRSLIDQIHSFLHWGTQVTYVNTSDPKKPKVEKDRWMSLVENSKGEISVIIYALQKSGDDDGADASGQVEADRNTIIEKVHLSECKRVVMGYDDEFLGTALKTLPPEDIPESKFHQSFTIVFRKKKFFNIICKDHSDFEAWIINLNKLLKSGAQWSKPLDISKELGEDELVEGAKKFCQEMQIRPEEYLYAQDKIAERRDRFITLYDVRSSAKLDLYHSQRLFQHMRLQGYISQATLFYLTDKFADALMARGLGGVEDEQQQEGEPSASADETNISGNGGSTRIATVDDRTDE